MTAPQAPKHDELELVSMYLNPPVGNAHGITLRLGPEHQSSRKGALWLDPNHCGLDAWGDRAGCTKIAIRSMEITTTRMKLRDPAGHHRWLHRVSGPDFDREQVSLIEYPAAGLWYLVYERKENGTWVVPLFPAKLFEANPGRTIGMRSGAAVREVIERGDAEEMAIEAKLLRGRARGHRRRAGASRRAERGRRARRRGARGPRRARGGPRRQAIAPGQ